MAIISTSEIFAGYEKMVIVHDASIKVDPKQIVLLIGANGSGKSTLVKSILGTAKIFRGSVYFNQKDVTVVDAYRKVRMGIGYCPQLANVFSSLSVRSNFELGTFGGKGKVNLSERVEEILGIFPDLKERLESKVSTLSGGLRQMVALGRALVGKPSVMLLDEPTAGMAPIAVKSLLSKVAALRELGITMLLVEQNVKSAVDFADYVYLMSQGKVLSEFTGSEIRGRDVGELLLRSVAAKS